MMPRNKTKSKCKWHTMPRMKYSKGWPERPNNGYGENDRHGTLLITPSITGYSPRNDTVPTVH